MAERSLSAADGPEGRPGARDVSATDPKPAATGLFTRKNIMFALKVAISVALIAWIVQGADLKEVGAALANIDPIWLLPAIASQFVSSGLRAARWGALLSARGVRPGWPYLFISVLCSVFFRQFLPSTMGGDAIRAYDGWKAGATPGQSITALLVDRLLGMATLAMFVLIALVLWSDMASRIPGAWQWLSIAIAVILAAMWFLFGRANAGSRLIERIAAASPRFMRSKLQKILDTVTAYRGETHVLLRAYGWSTLLQINVVFFYWLLANALGFDIPVAAFFVIVPIAVFVMMAPISINGIGLREGVFIFLLGLWAVEPAAALAFAWLEYGFVILYGVIGGAVYALRPAKERPDPATTAALTAEGSAGR